LGYASEVMHGSVCPRLVVASFGLRGGAVCVVGDIDIERRGGRNHGHGPVERAASQDMHPEDA
jgi:hypothetical protein